MIRKGEPGYRICRRGVWDTTVPGVRFDADGVSNYSRIHDILVRQYPRGEQGLRAWQTTVEKLKAGGRKRRYDCLIGVSGGTDSSYLMYVAKEHGLRPLAVNLDNGWNSEISYINIQKVTNALGIDLETYVIDYEEVKDILASSLKASLPWADSPTDLAIQAILYKTAAKEGVRAILIGNDFRSEGKQPTEWTYSDGRQLRWIQKKFGTKKIETFPIPSLTELLYLGYVRGIKLIQPFNYLEYRKKSAQQFLTETYGWEYYGGHHHENIFTKFVIAYWLPKKFGIDKRIITYSAQVLSGEMTREEALAELDRPPYEPKEMERDKEYVIKKLGLTDAEFEEIWNRPNRDFLDYPSNYPLFRRTTKILVPILRLVVPMKPKMFVEMDVRNDKSA